MVEQGLKPMVHGVVGDGESGILRWECYWRCLRANWEKLSMFSWVFVFMSWAIKKAVLSIFDEIGRMG